MVLFDKYGNITPYEILEIDLDTFYESFISKMNNPEHREKLFTDYLNYTKNLCKIISNNFFQWINGSFVTQKNNPKDIDLVSFIDCNLIENKQQEINNFVYPLSKENYNVDAYIVKLYPDNDRNLVFSKSDTLYRFHHFQKTKPNKNGEKFYKGFIKNDLSHENI